MYDFITKIAAEYGAHNLRFVIPMRPLRVVGGLIAYKTSSDEANLVVCEVNEKTYKLSENYKIQLTATLEHVYGSDRFYISDFESLMERHPDQYRAYVLTGDGYHHLPYHR